MAIGLAIPRYLVGRNVSVMGTDAMKVNADGSLSLSGNFANFRDFGVFDSFELELDNGLEEISATDMPVENYVETKTTWTCTLGEIEKANGESQIMNQRFCCHPYIYVEAQVTDPVTGNASELQVVGIVGSISKGIKQGKNVVMCTIRPCGYAPFYAVLDGGSVYSGYAGTSANYVPQVKVKTSTAP